MPALQREAAVAAEKQLLEANARRRAEEQLLTVSMSLHRKLSFVCQAAAS